MKKPVIILIGCEGKTEYLYLNIILRAHNIHGVIIMPNAGELFKLIDSLENKRAEIAREYGIEEKEIETWAACDDDNRGINYTKLSNYSSSKCINLAYSRPQFEAYLLQHFEQCKLSKQQDVLKEINIIAKRFGENKYDKTDLGWLEEEIIANPKIIEIAITNSNIRSKRKGDVFITFQSLVEHILAMQE